MVRFSRRLLERLDETLAEDLNATLTKDPHRSLQASTFQGEESEYPIPIFTYFISLYD